MNAFISWSCPRSRAVAEALLHIWVHIQEHRLICLDAEARRCALVKLDAVVGQSPLIQKNLNLL
jgi:hypothetical protein